MDQADHLRILKQNSLKEAFPKGNRSPIKITVVSGGKGGVGKSNIALNIALALTHQGEKICLLDADFGLANIDVLLGMKPKYHIGHVFAGQKKLSEILIKGPGNIHIIPAASGLKQLAELSENTLKTFISEARQLGTFYDRLIIDTSAGISKNVMLFLLNSSEILVVATPEPTSITDSYALIKSYRLEGGTSKVMIIMNMCQNSEEGEKIGKRLGLICQNFLSFTPEFLGTVSYDTKVLDAIRRQKAFLDIHPEGLASKQVINISKRLKTASSAKSDLGDFFNAMKSLTI